MESGPALSSAGRMWRSRIDEAHDYSIIRNDTVFRTSLHASWVYESQHEAAREHLASLLSSHEGQGLDDIFRGEEQETTEGACYCIRSEEHLALGCQDRRALRDLLLSDLQLVRGIGARTEQRLKARGYRTIADLVRHQRFGKAAARSLRILSGDGIPEIEGLVTRWHSPSHQNAFLTSGLYHPSDLLFIDLETMGLFSRPIILFGLAGVQGDTLHIAQYLLRGIEEELPSLSVVREVLAEDRVIVSFNGKAFDVPCLLERSAFYGRPAGIKNPHYDLLHVARSRWRDRLPDCRLGTLERHLFGVCRECDVPGAMVPEFYEAYLATGNPGPLVPIVSHNRQDIVSLARLFALFRNGEP
ncbi:MAG TPA: ribonuclease H-like domain-containing protein [Methanoregulaceae archaeon]|nr:MAG: ribonuclease H-like domain-containing protein [Methanolinea sp.]HON81835.1 ribonuclease H-like domain-containing protein [Methanoregulaceae archaeon]HPD10865.1 ribonuclease H-like domain-containing protein [Methanoregulaceae archaeon]HRT15661.1 ribonuclease H-like domain-containing protein [Methanoregulaceae archaeon]HRU31500.1 ribonuclease H-like domain-containing protein [Methanoregulaceae archaeon]